MVRILVGESFSKWNVQQFHIAMFIWESLYGVISFYVYSGMGPGKWIENSGRNDSFHLLNLIKLKQLLLVYIGSKPISNSNPVRVAPYKVEVRFSHYFVQDIDIFRPNW